MKTEIYSIRGLKGPLADVLAKVQADAAIPESDKEYLAGKISASGFAGVTVDAHVHALGGNTNVAITISKLY
jgi:hypothetical protein